MCKCDTHAHGIISAKQTVTIAACCFRAAAEAWVRGRWSRRRRRWGPGRRRLRWGGASFAIVAIIKKSSPAVVCV